MPINSDGDFEQMRLNTRTLAFYIEAHFGIPAEMLRIYFSGAKGFHIIIPAPVLGISPKKDLNSEYRQVVCSIAKLAGIAAIDTKIYDRRRLFRFPNSRHGGTGLFKAPVTKRMLFDCDWAGMKIFAARPRRESFLAPVYINRAAEKYREYIKGADFGLNIRAPKSMKEIPPCVESLLSSSICEGNRNNCAIMLASSLLQCGYGQERAYEILSVWNDNNRPPLPERELCTVILNAGKLLGNNRGYGCSSYRRFCGEGICKIAEIAAKKTS